MPKTRSALSRLAIPLIAYLLLVIPASIYYFFHTQSQSEYFAARNFRHLVGAYGTTAVHAEELPEDPGKLRLD
jgi:hypothetical protein